MKTLWQGRRIGGARRCLQVVTDTWSALAILPLPLMTALAVSVGALSLPLLGIRCCAPAVTSAAMPPEPPGACAIHALQDQAKAPQSMVLTKAPLSHGERAKRARVGPILFGLV